MTPNDFRRIALAMHGAIAGEHMGHPDFRANGRIFATIHPDQKFGMVKLTPEQQQKFIKENPGMFAPEKSAWGRAGCTRVRFASLNEDVLGEALTLAWQNVGTKRAAKKRKRGV